jgi:hypothetical protein
MTRGKASIFKPREMIVGEYDTVVTAAAADRLVNHRVILELNIESYRMEAAMKKKNEKPDDPAKGSK